MTRAASRVATGWLGRNVEVDDDTLGLVASSDRNQLPFVVPDGIC
jgi:hypothetical protein